MTKKKVISLLLLIAISVAILAGTIIAIVLLQPNANVVDKRYDIEDGNGNGFESGTVYDLPSNLVFNAAANTSSTTVSSVEFRVNFEPAYATDKRLEWNVEWVDSQEAFAVDKVASSYIKIIPKEDTAIVQCTAAFGSKIKLKVRSQVYEGVEAACIIDFRTRLVGVTSPMMNNSVTAVSSKETRNLKELFYKSLNFEYSPGTLPIAFDEFGYPEGFGDYDDNAEGDAMLGALVAMPMDTMGSFVDNVMLYQFIMDTFTNPIATVFNRDIFTASKPNYGSSFIAAQNAGNASTKGAFAVTIWCRVHNKNKLFEFLIYFTNLERSANSITINNSSMEFGNYA